MYRHNLNNITVSANIIFLVIFSIYFYINSLKNNENEIVNRNNHDDIFIANKANDQNLTNIEIEDVQLPKLEEEILKKPVYKKLEPNKLVEQKKIDRYPQKEILEKIDFKKIKPLKYIKHVNNNVYKKMEGFNKLEVYKPKKIDIKNIQTLKYRNDTRNIFNKKIEIIKPQKNDKIKIENLKFKNKNNQNRVIEYNVNMLKNIGNKALSSNKNFQLEFLWPVNTFNHDKIYQILNRCLKSETVLIDKNNIIYGFNGEIKRQTLKSEFSKIIRVPTHVHSRVEKNKINNIRSKFLDNSPGKHLRLYKKNIDAYIIGFYLKLANKNKIKIKDIKKLKGKYSIINNQLYLDNLKINSINFKDKILLSSFSETCNI